jgi:hypothetical protein
VDDRSSPKREKLKAINMKYLTDTYLRRPKVLLFVLISLPFTYHALIEFFGYNKTIIDFIGSQAKWSNMSRASVENSWWVFWTLCAAGILLFILNNIIFHISSFLNENTLQIDQANCWITLYSYNNDTASFFWNVLDAFLPSMNGSLLLCSSCYHFIYKEKSCYIFPIITEYGGVKAALQLLALLASYEVIAYYIVMKIHTHNRKKVNMVLSCIQFMAINHLFEYGIFQFGKLGIIIFSYVSIVMCWLQAHIIQYILIKDYESVRVRNPPRKSLGGKAPRKQLITRLRGRALQG